MRTTTRLRTALAVAVQDGRDQSEVAVAHRVSWPTVQRAVVAHGAVELAEPEPTRVLGLDETRFGRPRWRPDGHHDDGRIRWQRTDPWETGFVDITGDQALLGQVDGRTSAAVAAWLASRTEEFRARIEVVVIDPQAGYAAAVRAVLPAARVAVDHFHLIMLGNRAVTAVRQRVTRDLLGRRGQKIDLTWANRRLLLRGHERLSERALARMGNGCIDNDPSGQILSAWIAKEELRALCATATRGGHRHEIRDRLWAFYQWCADAQIPELTTLAETIETWWPAVEVFLTTGLTNARTEGTNRLIKQVKRADSGFRNRELPTPSTVALHPAHPPIVSEETDGARLRSKSRVKVRHWADEVASSLGFVASARYKLAGGRPRRIIILRQEPSNAARAAAASSVSTCRSEPGALLDIPSAPAPAAAWRSRRAASPLLKRRARSSPLRVSSSIRCWTTRSMMPISTNSP